MNEYGLTESTMRQISEILSQYQAVQVAKIYGSRAKGTYHERSDVDLAVIGNNLDRFTLSALQLAFSESDIPLIVDIHNYQEIKNPQLLDHIDRVGSVIYSNGSINNRGHTDQAISQGRAS